jgi:non-ribosomal peptide synthetase component F
VQEIVRPCPAEEKDRSEPRWIITGNRIEGSRASIPGSLIRARSYVAASASQPVLEQTLGDALRLAGKTWPLKPALIQGALETSERRKWTFRDLIEQSEQVARALLSRFEPGDHVAIWMANQPEWLLVEFGAALAGLTLVTVNPAFLDEELIFVLKQSKARGRSRRVPRPQSCVRH